MSSFSFLSPSFRASKYPCSPIYSVLHIFTSFPSYHLSVCLWEKKGVVTSSHHTPRWNSLGCFTESGYGMWSMLTSLASETFHDESFYSYLLFLSPTWSRRWQGCITAAPPRSTLCHMLLAQGLFLFQRMPLVSWSPDHSLRSIINRNSSPFRQTNCICLLCFPKYLT